MFTDYVRSLTPKKSSNVNHLSQMDSDKLSYVKWRTIPQLQVISHESPIIIRFNLFIFKSKQPSWPSPPPRDGSSSYSLASTPRRNTQSMIDRSIDMADLMVTKWNPDTSGYAQVTSLDPESVSARSSRTSSRSSISDFEDDTTEDESRSPGDSISEIEKVSLQAMDNLKCIAECMIATGYAKECFKIYTILRKSVIDEALYKLGIEKISQNQFNKLTSESQDLKIQQWLHASKVALKTLFAGERILCDHVFEASDSLREPCFIEISRDAASLLFSFPELVSKSKKLNQMMLRVLDIYATIVEYWSDIDAIFSSESSSAVRALALNSLPKLADSVRSMFTEFESAVQKYSLKANGAAYGGGVDPLTIYSMNSLASLSYHAGLVNDILSSLSPPVKSLELYSTENTAPAITIRLTRLIGIVLRKIEDRSKLYKDSSTSYLFVANNLHHVVSTIRRSNLKYILGEQWIRNEEEKINNTVSNYVATAWSSVSNALPDSTATISVTEAKERFKKFNERFGEAYKKQSACVVVDQRLRDDIKARVERILVAKYRKFFEMNRGRVGAGSLNLVVRYTPEDVVNYLSDLYFDDGDGAHEGSSTMSFSSPSLSVMSADNRFGLIEMHSE